MYKIDHDVACAMAGIMSDASYLTLPKAKPSFIVMHTKNRNQLNNWSNISVILSMAIIYYLSLASAVVTLKTLPDAAECWITKKKLDDRGDQGVHVSAKECSKG